MTGSIEYKAFLDINSESLYAMHVMIILSMLLKNPETPHLPSLPASPFRPYLLQCKRAHSLF